MEIVVPDEYKFLYVQTDERPVVKVPAQILRQKAQAVEKLGAKHQKLIDEMIRVMRQANGIGLAAPQVGAGLRVIVIAPDEKPIPLVNPTVVEVSEEEVPGEEGCLSIPGLYGDVMRPLDVVVEGQDRRGKRVVYEMNGLAARVVLHEIDHLDGVLFTDKVDPATLHWMDPEKNRDRAE